MQEVRKGAHWQVWAKAPDEHLRASVGRRLLAEPVRGKLWEVESRWEARLLRASRSLSFGFHSESDGKTLEA